MNYDKWKRTFEPYMDHGYLKDWDLYDKSNKQIIADAIEDNRLWSVIQRDGVMSVELGLQLQTVDHTATIICRNPCNKYIGRIVIWSKHDEKESIIDRLNGLRSLFTYKRLKQFPLDHLQDLEEKYLE